MKKDFKMIELLIGILLVLFVFSAMYFFNNKPNIINNDDEEIIEEDPTVDFSKVESISGKYYYEDEHFTSMFGIDVSEFQKEIDWDKVSNDSVEFAYIRMGRRGATTGELYIDDRFEENYKGAKDNGIKVGVYFFSQALDEKEAREEAQFVIENIKDKELDLPVVYDCEEVFLEEGLVPRIVLLSKTEITTNAIAFMEEMKKNDYDVMAYTYPYWLQNFYDLARLADYKIWFAQYDFGYPEIDHFVDIWQYSKNGTINGIEGDVDLDIMFIEKETD